MGVCKNQGFIIFKGFLVEFLEKRRSWENQSPRKSPEKWTFLSLAFYNAPSLHTVDSFAFKFWEARKTTKKQGFFFNIPAEPLKSLGRVHAWEGVPQHSVLRRVLRRFWPWCWGKGSQKGSEKGVWYGFPVKKGSEKGSQKGFWEGSESRRCLERPLVEHPPLRRAPYWERRGKRSKSQGVAWERREKARKSPPQKSKEKKKIRA